MFSPEPPKLTSSLSECALCSQQSSPSGQRPSKSQHLYRSRLIVHEFLQCAAGSCSQTQAKKPRQTWLGWGSEGSEAELETPRGEVS